MQGKWTKEGAGDSIALKWTWQLAIGSREHRTPARGERKPQYNCGLMDEGGGGRYYRPEMDVANSARKYARKGDNVIMAKGYRL